ncbi:MAG: 50S ribosomal protein L21 [Bacteroidota bacterium]|nr:50S ribosomal protein L21 [Bacteroidota bacterium]
MYAIVQIAGKQYKVEKDKFLYTNKIDKEVGSTIDFTDVLLVDNDGKINVGSPKVKGAKVSATVLEHDKGDKILVFKMKRRKDYKKSHGHRQMVTKLHINSINV